MPKIKIKRLSMGWLFTASPSTSCISCSTTRQAWKTAGCIHYALHVFPSWCISLCLKCALPLIKPRFKSAFLRELFRDFSNPVLPSLLLQEPVPSPVLAQPPAITPHAVILSGNVCWLVFITQNVHGSQNLLLQGQ